MVKAVKWLVLVGLCWAVVNSLPSLARYLKMRSQ
jgi:hypothetical protein